MNIDVSKNKDQKIFTNWPLIRKQVPEGLVNMSKQLLFCKMIKIDMS